MFLILTQCWHFLEERIKKKVKLGQLVQRGNRGDFSEEICSGQTGLHNQKPSIYGAGY